MKLRSKVALTFALFLLPLVLLSCSPLTAVPKNDTAEAVKPAIQDATPPSLPVQYQTPSYVIDATGKDDLDSQTDDTVLKVGANITSNPKTGSSLREVMRELAKVQNFNISWASDVAQEALIRDVNIKANDDYYKTIDDLLRQFDYFYEMEGGTIVVKYRETKQFHIAMPFTKQEFSTGTGGNVLGGDVGGAGIAKNVEGTIKLTSEKNAFDIWKNVEDNITNILKIEKTKKTTKFEDFDVTKNGPVQLKENITTEVKGDKITRDLTRGLESKKGPKETQTIEIEVTGGGETYFFIDKPVGLITVTAPRPILKKVEAYLTSLENQLYKQISIEAKIIEVQLVDSSAIGINWDSVLKNFSIRGAVKFGAETLGNGVSEFGQVFPYVFSNDTDGKWKNGINHGSSYDPTRLVSNIRINTSNFDVFLNALQTQGNTKILSNPKISVLNGQPAMITVGQNITYIDKIEVDIDAQTGVRTFSAETASVLSGVGLALTANVLNNNDIVMSLVPVTSELQGEIEYRQVGEGEVGLPVINVREMSTTVRVKDGEMLVIGGLISDTNEETGNFAPVVGDIPLLKYLFGYEEKAKNKRELIILLKPRII